MKVKGIKPSREGYELSLSNNKPITSNQVRAIYNTVRRRSLVSLYHIVFYIIIFVFQQTTTYQNKIIILVLIRIVSISSTTNIIVVFHGFLFNNSF